MVTQLDSDIRQYSALLCLVLFNLRLLLIKSIPWFNIPILFICGEQSLWNVQASLTCIFNLNCNFLTLMIIYRTMSITKRLDRHNNQQCWQAMCYWWSVGLKSPDDIFLCTCASPYYHHQQTMKQIANPGHVTWAVWFSTDKYFFNLSLFSLGFFVFIIQFSVYIDI